MKMSQFIVFFSLVPGVLSIQVTEKKLPDAEISSWDETGIRQSTFTPSQDRVLSRLGSARRAIVPAVLTSMVMSPFGLPFKAAMLPVSAFGPILGAPTPCGAGFYSDNGDVGTNACKQVGFQLSSFNRSTSLKN